MNLEIKLKIGLGDLKFGEILENVTKLFGEPEAKRNRSVEMTI